MHRIARLAPRVTALTSNVSIRLPIMARPMSIARPVAPIVSKVPSELRFKSTASSSNTGSDGPFAVVSLLGADRKGIVRDFSALLAKMGANVHESRMSRLGGTFAVIMLVALKGNEFSEFQKQVAQAFPGFQVHTTLTEHSSPALHDPTTASYEIAVDGPDSVGIVGYQIALASEVLRCMSLRVAAVTDAIAKAGNITNIESEVRDAPFAGFKMFSMIARADITVDKVPELQKELAGIEDSFGLEIDLYEEDVTMEQENE